MCLHYSWLLFSLTKQEILSELLDLILQEPSPDLEEKLRFKLPNIASEVITCDVPQVIFLLKTNIYNCYINVDVMIDQ